MHNLLGAYYLHTNGELIWKNAAVFYNTTPEEYFESDFVKKYWLFSVDSPESPKEFLLSFLKEAKNLGASKEAIERVANQTPGLNLLEGLV